MNEKPGKPDEYAIQQHYGQGDRWVLVSLSSPKHPKPQKVGEKDKTGWKNLDSKVALATISYSKQ